jgi:hypothetical protein
MEYLHYVEIIIGGFIVFIQIIIALAVFSDAKRLFTERKPVVFLSPSFWGLAALAGGIVTLIAYWLFHYSTLRSK